MCQLRGVDIELEIPKGHRRNGVVRYLQRRLSKSEAWQRSGAGRSVWLKLSFLASLQPPGQGCPLSHAPHPPSQGTERGF